MIGTGDGNRPPMKEGCRIQAAETDSSMHAGTEELRLRVQQLSLREQIERNHFLLMRLNAASARLIQSIEAGDVFDAIAEIIANLIGSEEIAVFDFHPSRQDFSLAWSLGVEADALKPFLCGAGMFGRAVQQGMSQFQERQPEAALLPCVTNDAASSNSHFLHAGQVFVSTQPKSIALILGSCVVVCIWDPVNAIGGAPHYMLPSWDGRGVPSPRYGSVAISILLQKLLEA